MPFFLLPSERTSGPAAFSFVPSFVKTRVTPKRVALNRSLEARVRSPQAEACHRSHTRLHLSISACTSITHLSSTTTLLPIMDDSHSTSNLLCCFPTKEKRERAIDKTLETVSTALDVLDQLKDIVPVAGVGVAVPVLKTIVVQMSVSQQTLASQKLLAHIVMIPSENSNEQQNSRRTCQTCSDACRAYR